MRPAREARLFSAMLRHWRSRRGLSQLDLASAAGVSSRHVSFLETGRAQPSRDMVLRLAGTLGVPLRDQNTILQAAGFDTEFPEPALEELPRPVAVAIERMLARQEPYPLTVLNRRYDVLRVNAGGGRIFSRFVADRRALVRPLNVFALVFDPRLSRPFIQGWERLARDMAARLHREVLAQPEDTQLAELLASLFRHEGVPEAWRHPDFSLPSEPTVEVRLRDGDLELRFVTTLTQFSAPLNVTLDEIRLESYYPVDDATARACEELARREGSRAG